MCKRPNAQSLALFHRRIGGQADPAGPADLGAQGPHAGAAPPLSAWQADLDVRPGGLPARPGRREEPATWRGFELLEGAYDTRQCIRVLDGLGCQPDHQPVTVLWDNLGAHHAGELDAWGKGQPWLAVEYLPAYAPELNPVEGLWANLKDVELANLPGASLIEVADQARHGIQRVCTSDTLVAGFLAHTGLALEGQPST